MNQRYRLILWIMIGAVSMTVFLGMLLYRILFDPFYFGGEVNFSGELFQEKISVDIQTIDLIWVSGKVMILPSETEDIVVTQSFAGKRKIKMELSVSGDTLFLYDTRKKFRYFPHFLWSNRTNLEVRLPQKEYRQIKINGAANQIVLQSLKADGVLIESVAGEVQLKDCRFLNAFFSGTSGRIDAKNTAIKDLSVKTVSGEVSMEGEMESVKLNGVAVMVKLETKTMLREFICRSTSGSISLYLPENSGFTVKQDSVSSKFYSSFPTITNGNQFIYKDGSSQFYFYSVSGILNLYRK